MEVSDYINKAMTFAENAAKLSQKMSQGLVDNAREFGFPAAGDSGAQYFDTSEEKMRNIKRQLDSRNDREKLDGLKRLIAVTFFNIEMGSGQEHTKRKNQWRYGLTLSIFISFCFLNISVYVCIR